MGKNAGPVLSGSESTAALPGSKQHLVHAWDSLAPFSHFISTVLGQRVKSYPFKIALGTLGQMPTARKLQTGRR